MVQIIDGEFVCSECRHILRDTENPKDCPVCGWPLKWCAKCINYPTAVCELCDESPNKLQYRERELL